MDPNPQFYPAMQAQDMAQKAAVRAWEIRQDERFPSGLAARQNKAVRGLEQVANVLQKKVVPNHIGSRNQVTDLVEKIARSCRDAILVLLEGVHGELAKAAAEAEAEAEAGTDPDPAAEALGILRDDQGKLVEEVSSLVVLLDMTFSLCGRSEAAILGGANGDANGAATGIDALRSLLGRVVPGVFGGGSADGDAGVDNTSGHSDGADESADASVTLLEVLLEFMEDEENSLWKEFDAAKVNARFDPLETAIERFINADRGALECLISTITAQTEQIVKLEGDRDEADAEVERLRARLAGYEAAGHSDLQISAEFGGDATLETPTEEAEEGVGGTSGATPGSECQWALTIAEGSISDPGDDPDDAAAFDAGGHDGDDESATSSTDLSASDGNDGEGGEVEFATPAATNPASTSSPSLGTGSFEWEPESAGMLDLTPVSVRFTGTGTPANVRTTALSAIVSPSSSLSGGAGTEAPDTDPPTNSTATNLQGAMNEEANRAEDDSGNAASDSLTVHVSSTDVPQRSDYSDDDEYKSIRPDEDSYAVVSLLIQDEKKGKAPTKKRKEEMVARLDELTTLTSDLEASILSTGIHSFADRIVSYSTANSSLLRTAMIDTLVHAKRGEATAMLSVLTKLLAMPSSAPKLSGSQPTGFRTTSIVQWISALADAHLPALLDAEGAKEVATARKTVSAAIGQGEVIAGMKDLVDTAIRSSLSAVGASATHSKRKSMSKAITYDSAGRKRLTIIQKDPERTTRSRPASAYSIERLVI